MTSPPPHRAEWLEADGLGGYASGTAGGLRTRRYHALLLAATTPPGGRMVLVNGFDAEWVTEAGAVSLTAQRYLPGVDAPENFLPPESFTAAPWPRWVWTLPGGGRIAQEIFVPRDRAAVVVRWRMLGSGGRLRVRPFFSGRDHNALHHENPVFNFVPETLPAGQRWSFYPGVPAVRVHTNGIYEHEPCWYRNFLYDEEAARGLDAVEDLAAPGRYTFEGDVAVLIFFAEGLGQPVPDESSLHLAAEWARTETARRAAFPGPRQRAADAYLVRRDAGRTVIAGYPWFGDWGRDTFIALRGLCLATGRLEEAREILAAWAGLVSEGMLPNRFAETGVAPEYNSVDASLWYVIVVCEFLEAVEDDARFDEAAVARRATDRRPEVGGYPGPDALLAAVNSILTGYARGTRFGIRADGDGLLACGVPGVQLTWMDAKVGDWVVTPRIGKPVEVQALWLNALGLASRYFPDWKIAFEKGRAAFEQRFWNEARGCLYDVVDVDHQPGATDDRLRPNQLFAVGGLPLTFFEGERARRAVQLAQDHLWTPLGPRSLAPGEKDYAPHYTGDLRQRDGAYHQGTVWPWLAGPFLEAWVRVRGATAQAKAEARVLLEASDLPRLDLQGLGHIPEIADAEPPHTARGCPFQAWSVGEFLRLELKILRP